MQRYFTKICQGNSFFLSDNDIHHIKHVMRMKVNDMIEVVHNQDLYLARINSLNPFEIVKESKVISNVKDDVKIILAVGLLKEQKFNLVLQKVTELGVAEIIPLKLKRCVVKLEEKDIDKKLKRWQLICKEASEQSKRVTIPKICKPISLSELRNIEADVKIGCFVSEKKKILKNVLQTSNNCDKIIIAIGVEGGFTKEEEDMLNEYGYTSVTLGDLVLRSETAVIYAMSVINYEFMR
ncbi:MAG: RsmE family RNA methyltransferase [bacterium]|nr:RsmE family RNA methyltransferase [bacterium]